MIKTKEIRKALWKCDRELRKLRSKTRIGTTRHRYISVLLNWIWFLRQIELCDSRNLQFLDVSDVFKVKKGKISLEVRE